MSFYLIESLNHVGYYGNIPEPLPGHESAFGEFKLEQSDLVLLNDDFVDSINEACGTLLDYGDVDFFDADQCSELCSWLEGRLSKDCDKRLAELYRKLLELANKAIKLGTGVVVEL